MKQKSSIDTTTTGTPRFLTTNFDAIQKDNCQKAVAAYINSNGMTPKTFEKLNFKIVNILPHLQQLDRRWMDIPQSEMKTSGNRKLISYMNTHICRWKKDLAKVQAVIDTLPKEPEQSFEYESKLDDNGTISEKSKESQEEIKNDGGD